MKKVIKIILISFIIFCFFNTAYANTTVHLTIKTPATTLYDQNITVIPCDSDNNNATAATATPYCAILQLQPGIPSNWGWDATYGAYYLNSLDNISGSTTKDANGNDVYHYWDWSINGTEATTGLSEYVLQPNDLISLNFIDPGNTTIASPSGGGPLVKDYIPPLSKTVPVPAPLPPVKPTFDIKKAYNFLAAQQKSDGSFGVDLYTDWTAIALATSRLNLDEKYFLKNKLSGNFLTDYERHAMALMALGLNPYNTDGENYIEKITASFDGKQFGDPNEDNDDIFALIVLQNAGDTENDPMISTDISFVLDAQKEDGSWDESPDLTGAGMEALSVFNQNQQVANALAKAETFLKRNQKDDGSWNENASSTSWVLEGIMALDEKPENWKIFINGEVDGITPLDYLATQQDTDGGIKDSDLNTKIWETAYVASALSGKTWNQIMQKFEKPIPPTIAETPKKITKNINLKSENTTTVINAVPTATENPTPKKNWFERLLENIF